MDGLPWGAVGGQHPCWSWPRSFQFFSLCHCPEGMEGRAMVCEAPILGRGGHNDRYPVLMGVRTQGRRFFSFRLALNLFTSLTAVTVLALGVSVSKADIEHLLHVFQNPDLLTPLLLLRIPLGRVGPAIGIFNKDHDVT